MFYNKTATQLPQLCSHINIKSIFWAMQNKSVHHIYTHTVHIIAAEQNHT